MSRTSHCTGGQRLSWLSYHVDAVMHGKATLFAMFPLPCSDHDGFAELSS